MFTKKVTDSDAFIEMSSSAQALYFHLNQAADDDGFNNQIQIAMMKAHAGVDDLKVLMVKNFIIRFESGVIVIKHWRMHNVLRKDRYNPTSFQEELRSLDIKENEAYTLSDESSGCQVVANPVPQVRLGKVRLGEVRLDKVNKNIVDKPQIPPLLEDVVSYCNERNNGIDVDKWYDFYSSKGWLIGKSKMKDWKAAIRTWEKSSKPTNQSSNVFMDIGKKEGLF